MEQADVLPLAMPTWDAEFLEDTSPRRIVLEHYDREHVSLHRYLSFLGVDPETGREIVQESFLRLHQHLRAGGDQSNLRAWLYRVAHNLARNSQLSVRASRTDLLGDWTGSRDIAADTPSAEQEILAAERSGRVRQALSRLGPSQKECLVLRAQGLKYREIAEVLNLSVSTVAEHVQRGLDKLKELI